MADHTQPIDSPPFLPAEERPITTPFITAALNLRDNPALPPPPTAPLTGFWLTPPPEEDQ